MNSDDLHQLLSDRLELKIHQKLLFLDQWEEPDNFARWSTQDRERLYRRLLPKATKPTRSNYWVWFGSYGTSDFCPRYNKNRVVRILYEKLHGPLGSTRLVNSWNEWVSDVNPFKVMRSVGVRYHGHDDLKSRMGENYKLGVTMNARKLDKLANEAMVTLDEIIQVGFNDYQYPEEMFDCLVQLGHAKAAATEAIKRSDLMKGPLHASHRNHPDHPNNKVYSDELAEIIQGKEEDQEPAPQTGLVSDDPRNPELD